MKRSMLGILAAGAVASMIGSTAFAAGDAAGGGMGMGDEIGRASCRERV